MADGKSQRINSWSFLCAEKGWSWAWRDVRCVRHCEKASRSVLSIISPLNYFKKYQNIICAQHGLEIPIIPEFWVLLYVYIFFFKKYPYSLSLKESLMCHFLTLSRQECCCDIWLKIEIGKSPTLWILLRIFHPPAHLANKRTIFPAKIHFVIYHTENVLIERFLGPSVIDWKNPEYNPWLKSDQHYII